MRYFATCPLVTSGLSVRTTMHAVLSPINPSRCNCSEMAASAETVASLKPADRIAGAASALAAGVAGGDIIADTFPASDRFSATAGDGEATFSAGAFTASAIGEFASARGAVVAAASNFADMAISVAGLGLGK